MKSLKQKSYGKLEIDNTEKDIVQIWCDEGKDPQVVQVERENIKWLITQLIICSRDKAAIIQYVRLNCGKRGKQLAEELGMEYEHFRVFMQSNSLILTDLRAQAKQTVVGRRRYKNIISI